LTPDLPFEKRFAPDFGALRIHGAVNAVQLDGEGGRGDAASVHRTADLGIGGAAARLPFINRIQASFGRHDVTGVHAHTDDSAALASKMLGANAFTAGNHVAFGKPPTLHTAAHEAAHAVQQRGGVQLDGGVGRKGDAYERHADEVADLVVS